ncbi:MAG: dethiobiotin synthase [Pirellulales bacterium]
MIEKPPWGLFIAGTDTGVGKTRVAAAIARQLVARGHRVGVYKPAASGCELRDGVLVADDAVRLWEAALRPLTLHAVCPQQFAAPLAPHLAARAEHREIDSALLRTGLAVWRDNCDIVLVEGAGGLMSPLGDDEYVADLAADLGYPVIVVAANQIGVINQTLQTLIAAAVFRDGLYVAGVVLNRLRPDGAADPSVASNRAELERRAEPPVLAELGYDADAFDRDVDWGSLTRKRQS